MKALEKIQKARNFDKYFPATGALRRELYPKHLEFFRAGAIYRERLFLAGNRVGKSESVGGYETVLHLTGLYPDWWEGHRFEKPVHAWAAGDTSKTVRDILQFKILGPINDIGTGLIPRHLIYNISSKPGVPDAIEKVRVRHVSGGVSELLFKSYDQKREAFQGTEQDVILLDEEPPFGIYVECVLRTMATGDFKGGKLLCTFTPLLGLSETVLAFLPNGKLVEEQAEDGKYVVMADWNDAPHLSEKEKADLLRSIPPYQRDARTKGIPQLGSGAIYPVPESEIICAPFELPTFWPRCYGLDVGWNRTAALWAAIDRETDIAYLYSEHYQGQAEPPIHAAAIKARGEWIPGVIDPAARGRGQKDGDRLMETYTDLGLKLTKANNARESGIYETWIRLSTGRLKVFSTLANWLGEYRIYRRDEKGQVVKDKDHLMDDTRYIVLSGLEAAIVKPPDVYENIMSTGVSSWA